jgi:hypothetical protein
MPTPKGVKAELKTVDGETLLPAVVEAALGTKTFKQASKPLSEDQRALLSRAIKMDVDEFRSEFAQELRATGALLLKQLQERANELKPDAIAYSLAVVTDKANSIDGRAALQNASINVVVNNFGSSPKTALLSELDGLGHTKQVHPVSA